MCVLLFDVFEHLLLRKTDILKTCWKSNILGKKIWRNALALKSKKPQVTFGKTFILTFIIFVYKTMSQISFKLFCSGDKRLLSEFLRKWGWFQGHNERFPKYLGEKLKFQKTKTRFCRWKSTDNNDINLFRSLENSCTLCERNTFFTIIVNYRKIVQ